MPDLNAFLSAIGDVPSISDPVAVRRKSRDMTAQFSPIMRHELKDKFADVIVRPRCKDDVLKVASAAARVRMPIMMRGGGTATFGQGIPLKGGAVVDMTGLESVLWTKNGSVRAEAGARLFAIDQITRPTGWELRMHSSTKRHAAIGGFVGGGHAGVGSCVYGILRDRGNILGLQVVSVEEEPKVVELRGDDVNLVHHAYGTNGIMTEVEMPLAPAWPWVEVVIVFPEFMRSVEFSHALATSDGIVKKLVSMIGWPIPRFVRALRPYVHEGSNVVLCMVAAPFMDALRALTRDFAGEITSEAPEGEGPYGIPLYEFSWGHTPMHANKEDPDLVSNIGLYLDPDLVGAIRRSHQRFKELGGFHLEAKRFDGKLSFQGSPMYRFVDEQQMAAVMKGMADDGAMVANNHTFLVKEGGMKPVNNADAEFKRRMDPYDLINPGKMSFDAENQEGGIGAALPSEGWKYQEQKAS